MVSIIIPKRPYRYGRTRSEQERNLRKDGMTTMSEEQLDKCKFLERKTGFDSSFFDKQAIDKV